MTYISDDASPPIIHESAVSTTNSAAQTVTTTRAVVNGSEIQYTPDAQATHVLYQCSFQWKNEPDTDTHFYVSLVEKTNVGDAWSYVTDRSFAISIIDGAQACSYENIEILVPTWSGAKYLALYIRAALSSTEGSLHQLKMDDGSFNTGGESFTDTLVSATSLASYS